MLCSIGHNYKSSLNIASFDFGFSFVFTSYTYTTYNDNLLTVYENGTIENKQTAARSGNLIHGEVPNSARVVSSLIICHVSRYLV